MAFVFTLQHRSWVSQLVVIVKITMLQRISGGKESLQRWIWCYMVFLSIIGMSSVVFYIFCCSVYVVIMDEWVSGMGDVVVVDEWCAWKMFACPFIPYFFLLNMFIYSHYVYSCTYSSNFVAYCTCVYVGGDGCWWMSDLGVWRLPWLRKARIFMLLCVS